MSDMTAELIAVNRDRAGGGAVLPTSPNDWQTFELKTNDVELLNMMIPVDLPQYLLMKCFYLN